MCEHVRVRSNLQNRFEHAADSCYSIFTGMFFQQASNVMRGSTIVEFGMLSQCRLESGRVLQPPSLQEQVFDGQRSASKFAKLVTQPARDRPKQQVTTHCGARFRGRVGCKSRSHTRCIVLI